MADSDAVLEGGAWLPIPFCRGTVRLLPYEGERGERGERHKVVSTVTVLASLTASSGLVLPLRTFSFLSRQAW